MNQPFEGGARRPHRHFALGVSAQRTCARRALTLLTILSWSVNAACAHRTAQTTAGPGLAEIIANPGDTHKAATGDDRPIEVASLLGVGLRRPFLDSASAAPLERNLAAAADSLRKNPTGADALLWYGRRLGELGRYREAIDTFTVGIRLFPNDARFYRFRGQRYLTVRRPVLSIGDYQKAVSLMRGKPDEAEIDGAANSRDTPHATLHFAVWYQLAVSLYVRGDYGNTIIMLDSASRIAPNADARVAIAYWRYLALKRTSKDREAASVLAIAGEKLDVTESAAYWKVLQLFAGQTTVEALSPKRGLEIATASDAIIAYGASMTYWFAGQKNVARDLWKRMMGGNAWPSYGVLSAEADLERVQ